MQARSSACTDPGPSRNGNEDRLVDRPDLGLWAVADGAGGHALGEVASGMIADALEALPPGLAAAEALRMVRAAIETVHRALQDQARRRSVSEIVSTVVILLLREDHFVCLWAGDSRVYLLRNGELEQITRDHSLVQELLDMGAIDAEAARTHPRGNVITRAVGMDDALSLSKSNGRLLPGDRFLLCSDGVSKVLRDERLAALLGSGAGDVVAAALLAGSEDNVSAVVVDVEGGIETVVPP